MTKIFSDFKAMKRFADLQADLAPKYKTKFTEAIKNAADLKVTTMEELTEFYLTVDDVNEIFDSVVCPVCGGDGEVTSMEAVDPSEPHITAPVGTIPCPMCCPPDKEEEYDDQSTED